MIKYFKDLLKTLKSIDNHLSKIAACVKCDHHGHGDMVSMSIKHWND